MVAGIRLVVLIALASTFTNALWFKAYDRKTAEPFCFLDHMTQETDYIIKWQLDEVTQVDANATAAKTPEKVRPIIDFNITKYKDMAEGEAKNASRKYIDHVFWDSSKAENSTKGSFHFSVEHGRPLLPKTMGSGSVWRRIERRACSPKSSTTSGSSVLKSKTAPAKPNSPNLKSPWTARFPR